MFKPNLDLIVDEENAPAAGKFPYIAVFKKDGKTLVYLAAEHGSQKTYDMVDFVFTKFRPNISVVEFLHKNTAVEIFHRHGGKPVMGEAAYTAALSVRHNIPVILADFGYSEESCKIIYEQTKNDEVIKAFYLKWILNNIMTYERQFDGKTTLEKEMKVFMCLAYSDPRSRHLSHGETLP